MNAGDDTVVFHNTSGEVRGGKGEDVFVDAASDPVLADQPDLNRATTSLLRGGSGEDTFTLVSQPAPVRLDAEAGLVTWQDNAARTRGMQTYVGGTGNDVLLGSHRAETIRGSAGNDVIRARAGNDRVRGGADVDVVYGGAGRDDCTGEARHSC